MVAKCLLAYFSVRALATFLRILHKHFSPVSTHFSARDHYVYLHILRMKIKEMYIFGRQFS